MYLEYDPKGESKIKRETKNNLDLFGFLKRLTLVEIEIVMASPYGYFKIVSLGIYLISFGIYKFIDLCRDY